MARQRLTEPQDLSLAAVARQSLTSVGISIGDAAWLSDAVIELFGLAPGTRYSSVDPSLDPLYWIREFGAHWRTAGDDRAVAIGVLLDQFATNCPSIQLPTPGEEPTPEQAESLARLQAFVGNCRRNVVNFGSAFLRIAALRPSTDTTAPFWMAKRFALLGAITASDLVSVDSVRVLGDLPDWWNFQRSYHDSGRRDHCTNPMSLHLWLELQGAGAAQHLLAGMQEMALDDFLRLARGLAYAFGVWPRMEYPTHPEFFAERGEDFALVCRGVFDEANCRVASSYPASPELRHVWLRFAWMAIDKDAGWLSEDARKELLRAAADDLGRLRPLLRRASETDAREIADIDPHVRSCIFLLFKLGSLWQAVKPLLLAFRATGKRAVGNDLRYWTTQKPDDPPAPWEVFPRSLMMMLHHNMGREQAADPQLDALRSEFAQFCLGRLKSRESDAQSDLVTAGGLVEPDPSWREGFVQAVRALRVNPKGRGHHVLNWTRQHDPDPSVREVAAEAYAELRHQPCLPQGMSPRRAVFDALWWLRRAHLASLGEIIDRDGANRTREEEARRTTERTENRNEE